MGLDNVTGDETAAELAAANPDSQIVMGWNPVTQQGTWVVVDIPEVELPPSTTITLLNATSGDVNEELPAPEEGLQVVYKRTDGSVNNCNVLPNDSEDIDGGSSYPLTVQYESVSLYCDGTDWWVI